MSAVGLKTLDGNQRNIPDGELDGLRSGLRGALFLPGDPGYAGALTCGRAELQRLPVAEPAWKRAIWSFRYWLFGSSAAARLSTSIARSALPWRK